MPHPAASCLTENRRDKRQNCSRNREKPSKMTLGPFTIPAAPRRRKVQGMRVQELDPLLRKKALPRHPNFGYKFRHDGGLRRRQGGGSLRHRPLDLSGPRHPRSFSSSPSPAYATRAGPLGRARARPASDRQCAGDDPGQPASLGRLRSERRGSDPGAPPPAAHHPTASPRRGNDRPADGADAAGVRKIDLFFRYCSRSGGSPAILPARSSRRRTRPTWRSTSPAGPGPW